MMPMLTRYQARTRQSLVTAASPRADAPGRASTSRSEHPQQSSFEGGVNYSAWTIEGRPSVLAAGIEAHG